MSVGVVPAERLQLWNQIFSLAEVSGLQERLLSCV